MARVTIEDCVEEISNEFDLVVLAAERASQLSLGVASELERENDKNTVLALREIAEGVADEETLREAVVKNMQRVRVADEQEPEEDKDWSEQIKQLSAELSSLEGNDDEASEEEMPAIDEDATQEEAEFIQEEDELLNKLGFDTEEETPTDSENSDM